MRTGCNLEARHIARYRLTLIGFWRDAYQSRYRDAYFVHYPGVSRHGDWITMKADGACEVHGRSDSTINRGGVRVRSADIYQAVESLTEIADALVVGAELPDGDYHMPLFVVLHDGHSLTDELVDKIRTTIREHMSPTRSSTYPQFR